MSTDDLEGCEVSGLCLLSESLVAIVKIIDINNDKITANVL
jgi:hypothetical protein